MAAVLGLGFWFFFYRNWAYTHSPLGRLYTAIEAGDVRTVRVLLDQGVSVRGDPTEDEWLPPLEDAAGSGQDAIVSLLIDHGADPEEGSGWGTPLEGAASNGHLSTVRLLIRKGAVRHDRQAALDYALWRAAVEGQVPCAEYLIQQGANPKQKQAGTGSLVDACRMLKQPASLKMLQAHGAKE